MSSRMHFQRSYFRKVNLQVHLVQDLEGNQPKNYKSFSTSGKTSSETHMIYLIYCLIVKRRSTNQRSQNRECYNRNKMKAMSLCQD